MTEDACFIVYVTCASQEQAETIANALVNEQLAACVNIVPGIISIYRWESQVIQDQEWLLLIKTKGSLLEALRQKICALHSYRVVEVIAVPVAYGNPPYLQWIDSETL